ncbi:MAG: LytTR family DNA-binding domain-containing protein [Myxococcota bacterium]
MKHRVLIVDDERLARVALKSLLRERDDVTVVGEAHSVETAVRAVDALYPDVLFLDVRMRDGDGFDLLSRVNVRAHVVFVTAHSDHALGAFEVNALDYLMKPVQPPHLDRALSRITESLSRVESLRLQQGRDVLYAKPSEVQFVRAARDYTEIHLTTGRTAFVKEAISRWEERLAETCVRIHRSVIVNLEHIEEVTRKDGKWNVRLTGVDGELPVSRRLAPELHRRLALRY